MTETIPRRAGLSLSLTQTRQAMDQALDIPWLEVEVQDYMAAGGEPLRMLKEVSGHYPVAMHGDALSLASAESLNYPYLERLKQLLDYCQPLYYCEPLSWRHWQGADTYLPLPLPYTLESLDQVCINVRDAQNRLGRQLLLQNPAVYLSFSDQDMTEADFLRELVHQTNCGLLLDINNLYISTMNCHRDPFKTLSQYPLDAVRAISLSGHQLKPLDDNNILLVATRDGEATKPLWQLFREALNQLPHAVGTAFDWRTSSALDPLMEQFHRIDNILFEIDPDSQQKVQK